MTEKLGPVAVISPASGGVTKEGAITRVPRERWQSLFLRELAKRGWV